MGKELIEKPSKEEKTEALQRLLSSPPFRHSESLSEFLKFVGEKAIDKEFSQLKEYTIATEVLGKNEDFDPSRSSIVRSLANRVRRKLQEYYSTPQGIEDPIRIWLPRGHYHLQFSLKPVAGNWFKRAVYSGQKSVFLLSPILILIILGTFWFSKINPGSDGPNSEEDLLLSTFWEPFLRTTSSPLVIYSNALFLMTDSGDLLRFDDDGNYRPSFGVRVEGLRPLKRSGNPVSLHAPLYYADVYTGVGEVVAASRLAGLFAKFNKPFSIKRSRFVDFHDIKDRDVIFLGADLENAVLRKLPRLGEFIFERANPDHFEGQLRIRDLKRGDGGPFYGFKRDAETNAMQSEYALVSVLEGFARERYLMVLAGLSTLGTQAAAEYMTSPSSLAELRRHLAVSSRQAEVPQHYQVLLRVDVLDGTPVKTHYVNHRKLK